MTAARILAIAIILLFSTVFAPALLLGESVSIETANAAADPTTESTTGPAPIVGGTACQPDYWVVSGRRLPTRHDAPCACCPLDYFHVGPDGCVRFSDEAAFRGSLVPNVPVCIVIHGSFVDASTVWTESHNTYQWLRNAAPERPVHLVFYTWNSDPITYVPHIDAAVLGKRSAYHGLNVARLVNDLPPGQPVCLMGHSHGARTVAATLHALAGGAIQGCCLCQSNCPQRRIRAVFAAAAMDHHWLNPGQRYERTLWPVECLANLQNHHDVALSGYWLRKPFSRHALGHAGLSRRDIQAIGCQCAKVTQVDVSRLIGCGHVWPRYYHRPEISWTLVPYVYFPDVGALDAAAAASHGKVDAVESERAVE